MKNVRILLSFCALVLAAAALMGGPTVYPTGTTIYLPEKCWSGYTIFQSEGKPGAVLIDMNGKTACNGGCDLILNVEDLLQWRIKPLSPNRLSSLDPNQLHADSQVRITSPQASCQQEIQVPFRSYVVNRSLGLPQCKRALCRQDPKR